jgi:DNA-binding transcriptional regulator YdaS (Cro superfamily)
MGFQRTGLYVLMHMKRRTYAGKTWDSKYWHPRISRECHSRSDKMLNIWENYITELFDPANRPENIEAETEEEVHGEEKDPELNWKKLSRRWRMKQATRDDDVPGDYLNCWEVTVSK